MSDNALNFLPNEERDKFIRSLLKKRIKTREDLKNWLLFFLNVDLADCTVSRFATTNPLDMVWEIYQFCCDNEALEPKSVFYIAGRSSQKTLSAAVLQILLPLHFKRGVVHLGGTKAQAKRAYQYFTKFVNRKYIKDYLKDKPTQEKTVFVIDEEEVEVEILPISPMSVQGPHQPAVSLDELGSLSPDKVKAYEDVSGIPIYTHDGKPWVKFGISSRKGKYTVIEQEYEKKDKSGVEFRFWTVFENTRRCPDSLSTTEPLEMYVDALENTAYIESEYQKLNPEQQSKLTKVSAYKGCYTCPLRAQCAGDLKKQTSTCRSMRPVQSVIQQFKQAPSLEWWLSQSMSISPSAEGQVFPKFKRDVFEKTPAEIYEIFSGNQAPEGFTEDDLIRVMNEAGVKKYAGLDHGYTHPTAVVVVYEDSRENAYIMASVEEAGLEPQEVLELVKRLHKKYQFTHLFPDTEAPAMNKMIASGKFCTVVTNFTKDIEKGITLIRGKLSPTVGSTKLFGVSGRCDSLIANFEKYHFKHDGSGDLTDKVNDIFDDSISALRYAAQNRWDKKNGLISGETPASPLPFGVMTAQQRHAMAAEEGEKIRKQQEQWLSNQIKQSLNEGTAATNTQESQGKGVFWSID